MFLFDLPIIAFKALQSLKTRSCVYKKWSDVIDMIWCDPGWVDLIWKQLVWSDLLNQCFLVMLPLTAGALSKFNLLLPGGWMHLGVLMTPALHWRGFKGTGWPPRGLELNCLNLWPNSCCTMWGTGIISGIVQTVMVSHTSSVLLWICSVFDENSEAALCALID